MAAGICCSYRYDWRTDNDGFCRMHFKMASQGAPTVHESAKKSGAETDSNAKTATNDKHGTIDLGGTRSTTKHILDLVDSTKPETSASVASTTSTDGVVA